MALNDPEVIAVATPEVPLPHVALHNWSAGANPAVTDDSADGYEPGSFWFNVVTPYRFFVCTDAAAGAAVWREIQVERHSAFVSAVAGENLTATNLVHLYNDTGTLKARKADASDNTRPCDGWVTTSPTTGQSGIVYMSRGAIMTGLSGLTVGDDLYLSETAGAMTATPPSTSGNIVQKVAKALSATTAVFVGGSFVEVA